MIFHTNRNSSETRGFAPSGSNLEQLLFFKRSSHFQKGTQLMIITACFSSVSTCILMCKTFFIILAKPLAYWVIFACFFFVICTFLCATGTGCFFQLTGNAKVHRMLIKRLSNVDQTIDHLCINPIHRIGLIHK